MWPALSFAATMRAWNLPRFHLSTEEAAARQALTSDVLQALPVGWSVPVLGSVSAALELEEQMKVKLSATDPSVLRTPGKLIYPIGSHR